VTGGDELVSLRSREVFPEHEAIGKLERLTYPTTKGSKGGISGYSVLQW
jgi:hypothetical protein